MSSHPSSAKTRHYAHLASRINALQAGLSETEAHMGKLADQLGDMSRLGAWTGSQFMAASRLLDADLENNPQVPQDGQGQEGAQARA